jgi:hypothetical protein
MDVREVLAPELDGVREEILEHLHELRRVGAHHREILSRDDRLALLDHGGQVPDRFAKNGMRVRGFDRIAARADARVGVDYNVVLTRF